MNYAGRFISSICFAAILVGVNSKVPDDPRTLIHHAVNMAAIPYGPSQNPISESLSLNAGNDLISVVDPLSPAGEGWLERRPGFSAAFEVTPTTFGIAPVRQFTWRKWGGAFITMVNVITGGNSLVYKLQAGTDNSFQLLYTSTSSTSPFDFVVSNNFVYFSDGTNKKKWDGTKLTNWGISPPAAIPGVSIFGIAPPTNAPNSFYGYKYAYAYGNSSTGHISSPSYNPNSTGPFTNKTVEVIVDDSPDTQVDKIHIYRTTDGGDGILFELPNSPTSNNPSNVNTPGSIGYQGSTLNDLTASGTYNNGAARPLFFNVVIDSVGATDTFKWSEDQNKTWTTGVSITGAAQVLAHGISVTFGATTGHGLGDYWAIGTNGLTDVALDSGLNTSSKVNAPSNNNNPPPAMNGVLSFANRLWGFAGSSLYCSGFEEIPTGSGVDEECFPPNNNFNFSDEVQGIGMAGDGLIVMAGGRAWKITGNSLDTFRRDGLFGRIGTRQRATFTPIGNSLAWLDSAGVVRITDGYTQSEISRPIRSDLAGINQTLASMCFHSDGKRQFIFLLDGGASKVRAYDMDLDIWLPPWSVGGGCIASNETAVGVWTLMLAHSSGKVMTNDFAHYNDNASTYTPSMTTQLLSILRAGSGQVSAFSQDTAGEVGDLEYVSIESDVTQPVTVKYVTDDDPSQASFTDISSLGSNPISPAPLRIQGTYLLEQWYYVRTPGIRRAAIKLTWANNQTNFKLYGFDLASYRLEQ